MAHYPSWGSETHPGPPVSPAATHRLTTPHGDRKHLDAIVSQPTRIFSSLPLMGIGNQRDASVAQRPVQDLTTPHGDRKHLDAIVSQPTRIFSSLPLMGIGNQRVASVAQRPVQDLTTPHGDRKLHTGLTALENYVYVTLTTPHGDRKRHIRPAKGYPSLAHYPSWGSETASEGTTTVRFDSSLPLMGIENLR